MMPLLSKATVYSYSTSNADIVITNSTFGVALTAGDVVEIDFRSGGYGYMSLIGLTSGTTGFAPSRMITIRFKNGAYLKARSDNTFQNDAVAPTGIRVVSAIVLARPEALLRFSGNATRYPKWIWFDSCATHQGRGLFTLNPSGGANYANDSNNMYAWWKITNSSYDSTWLNDGDNQAIQFFAPFSIGLNTFSRDIEIANNTFNHYPAIGNPSIFIQLALCFKVLIHDNTFSNLGMTNNPVGHSSAVNFYLCLIYGYNNHFGPNIIGDDFRGDPTDLIAYPTYQGRGRIYNNITFNKIKYAHSESRWDGFNPAFNTLIRKRAGAEHYNITCFNMGTGARVGSFYSGSAAIVDFFETDTVTLYNSILVQVNPLDTPYNNSYVNTVDFALAPPYSRVDTGHNYRLPLFVQSGFQDSISFIPILLPTYGGGVAVPAYIITDINGNPRTIAGRVDIGAVENQGAAPPDTAYRLQIRRLRRLRVLK